MRKILQTLLLILFGSVAIGQQIAQNTQFMFNPVWVNPASAGIKECNDLRMGHRNQWVGFEGAPKTSYVTLAGRLKLKGTTVLNYHGWGAIIDNDAIGPFGKTSIYGIYTYHMKVMRGMMLSVGTGVGFHQIRLDARRLNPQSLNDPAITGSQSVILVPDIAPGVMLYSKDVYLGLSIKNVIPLNYRKFGVESKLSPHVNIMAGKKIEKTENITLNPNAIIRLSPSSPPSIDLNMMVDFNNIFMIGGTIRNIDAIAGIVRLNVGKKLSVGYSYDLVTSKLRAGTVNTHEFTIGLYSCPSTDQSHPYSCPVFE